MYVFDAPPQASLAVQGTFDRFPIRRIFCVGRNPPMRSWMRPALCPITGGVDGVGTLEVTIGSRA